jgi:hypothetical protein
LISNGSGKDVCYKNEHAAYSERKETIQAPGLNAAATLGARTVE